MILKKTEPAGSRLERISGGRLIRTNAPRVGFTNPTRTQYMELKDFGAVSSRTFLIRGVGFVVLPSGFDLEIMDVDDNTTFKFEILP